MGQYKLADDIRTTTCNNSYLMNLIRVKSRAQGTNNNVIRTQLDTVEECVLTTLKALNFQY